MLKINDIEITEQTFEDLLSKIQNTRKWLAEGEVAQADFILGVLELNLEKNLKEDKHV